MENQQISSKRNILSPKQMRWLFTDLKEDLSVRGVKFKLAAHGWQSSDHKIIHISDTNVVIIDEKVNQLKFISLIDVLEISVNRLTQKKTIVSHYEVKT